MPERVVSFLAIIVVLRGVGGVDDGETAYLLAGQLKEMEGYGAELESLVTWFQTSYRLIAATCEMSMLMWW